MEEIKTYKKIDIKSPVMIAGWPGMGSVALGAVDYLKRKLRAIRFAEIKLDPLATLDSVSVEEGVAKFPEPPRNVFYYTKNPDLIIFEGEAQMPGPAGINLVNKVLDLAAEFNVPRIYTGAAFPLPISYKEMSEVYGAVNNESLKGVLTSFGIIPMEGGHISGLNGIILGFAEARKIEAVCLLATMPQYAISLPNPKASWAIIDTLRKMLKFEVELLELEDYIKEMGDKMAIIEDKVKDVFPTEKEEPQSPPPTPAEKKVPAYIMEKIEKLFSEAKTDKAKAIVLKKELDRWDLYKVYEDRFLDLFKENQ